MKKKILFLFLAMIGFTLTAQTINNVPSLVASKLENGWYKYQSEGAVFDVEVKEGYIVKGNIKWFNNDFYSGSLSSSKISGKGTYTWSNGDRYEGSFRNNLQHGKGTIYYKNGEKFSGKWKKGKRHGKGKVWKTDGSVVQAIWENDSVKTSK